MINWAKRLEELSRLEELHIARLIFGCAAVELKDESILRRSGFGHKAHYNNTSPHAGF